MKILDLSDNKITEFGFRRLLTQIDKFAYLEELYMRNNILNDNVLILLAEFSKSLGSLKVIDLRDNNYFKNPQNFSE